MGEVFPSGAYQMVESLKPSRHLQALITTNKKPRETCSPARFLFDRRMVGPERQVYTMTVTSFLSL
jgi:hypothetical protein